MAKPAPKGSGVLTTATVTKGGRKPIWKWDEAKLGPFNQWLLFLAFVIEFNHHMSSGELTFRRVSGYIWKVMKTDTTMRRVLLLRLDSLLDITVDVGILDPKAERYFRAFFVMLNNMTLRRAEERRVEAPRLIVCLL